MSELVTSPAISFDVQVCGDTFCSNCKAYHSSPRDGQCLIPMNLPCVCCGEPVEALSVGGNTICGLCDTGTGECCKAKWWGGRLPVWSLGIRP